MKIYYHKNFIKSYQKRILPNKNLSRRFQERLELFVKDPSDPPLKDHQLTGKKALFRAFSVTGDVRVVYERVEDGIRLYDVGTHNQVY